MILKPFNRYLLVQPVIEEEDDDGLAIVLPTGYKKKESPYVKCMVRAVSHDSKFIHSLKENDTIVVERRMLNKIDFNDKTSYLVLENYVYGRLENETK